MCGEAEKTLTIGFASTYTIGIWLTGGITRLAAECTWDTVTTNQIFGDYENTQNLLPTSSLFVAKVTKVAKDYFTRHLYLYQTKATKGLD